MSAATDFHALRVRSIDAETDEAVIVTFEVPHELQALFAFHQGQYLTLRATIDGQDVRRSYSICAGVDDALLRVGVRKVAGGVFSQWINQRLKAGDTLQVMPPQGRFYVPLDARSQRHYLGVAGGSGITPILSILRTVLQREPASRFTLIYANRMQKSTMFKQALDDLKNEHMARLAVHHVFSGEDTELPLNQGLLDRSKLADFLQRLVPASRIDHAFVCGPHQMNDEAEAALRAAGVTEDRIHIERFGIAPQAGTGAAVEHQAQAGDAAAARVVLLRDGLKREVEVRAEHASILDAASAAGLEVPYSCTSGVCGTCRAVCTEGRVRMTRNFALTPDEVAAGQVLACQAHPLTERVVLDFDAR
jgi:ring-1,2-phenylacetyl-CoA epoxidase subunit PaaE